MTEERDQRLGTEVIGKFSPGQERELAIVALTVAQQLRLNPRDSQHKQQIFHIVMDCFTRGLGAAQRTWPSPQEQVSPFISMGLQLREHLVNQLTAAREGQLSWFIPGGQQAQISLLTPLSANLPGLEPILAEVRGKKKNIEQFHHELFEKSQLMPQAEILKKEAQTKEPQLSDWEVHNRLYANLLLGFALYKRPSLMIEPEDVAAVADMWQDPIDKAKAQEALVDQMTSLAKRLKISLAAVAEYTRGILTELIEYHIHYGITAETALLGKAFLFPSSTLKTLVQESSAHSIQPQPTVSEVELQKAGDKLAEYLTLYQAFQDSLSLDNDEIESSPEAGRSIEFLCQVTPLELVFLMRDYLTNQQQVRTSETGQSILGDITEFVPISTYLEALPLVYSKTVRVAETGAEVTLFPDKKSHQETQTYIKDMVLSALVKDNLALEKVVEKLPLPVLDQLTDLINPAELSDSQRQAFVLLDNQTWTELCLIRGLEYDPETKSFNIPPDQESIIPYLALLPADRRDEIGQIVLHQITF